MIEKVQNIVLDLDQTLISAESIDAETTAENFVKYLTKAHLFKFIVFEMNYIVFERPGLQKFLDYLFSNFNVSVWTAATKDYALFIAEKIIIAGRPERKLDCILFNEQCNYSIFLGAGMKNLKLLSNVYGLTNYRVDNTIIIDDLPEVHSVQPNNGILIRPFYFAEKDSENDNQLAAVQATLESHKIDKFK